MVGSNSIQKSGRKPRICILEISNTILILSVLIIMASPFVLNQIEHNEKQRILTSVFNGNAIDGSSGYRVIRSEEVEAHLLDAGFKKLTIHENYAVIELENDETLMALFNKHKKVIVLERMW